MPSVRVRSAVRTFAWVGNVPLRAAKSGEVGPAPECTPAKTALLLGPSATSILPMQTYFTHSRREPSRSITSRDSPPLAHCRPRSNGPMGSLWPMAVRERVRLISVT